jgi:hypothetical protein
MRQWMGILSWDRLTQCAVPRGQAGGFATVRIGRDMTPVTLRVRTPDGSVYRYHGPRPGPGETVRAEAHAGPVVARLQEEKSVDLSREERVRRASDVVREEYAGAFGLLAPNDVGGAVDHDRHIVIQSGVRSGKTAHYDRSHARNRARGKV